VEIEEDSEVEDDEILFKLSFNNVLISWTAYYN
jgi:hypothetical protein